MACVLEEEDAFAATPTKPQTDETERVDVVAPPVKVAVSVDVTIVSDPARAIVQSLLPVLMNL